MSNVAEVNESNFEAEVLQSTIPVVVDFWAPWCGPCRPLGPTLDAVAAEFEGQVKFVKCNIDENPNMPSQYGFSSIPALLLVKDGQPAGLQTGAVSKAKLEEFIRKAL